MAGSVNKVQIILLALMHVLHLYGMTLYGYASLPLQIHTVEDLVLEFPFIYCIGFLKQPVGQSAFTVVDMGDDTEIPDSMHPVDCLKNRCKYIKL